MPTYDYKCKVCGKIFEEFHGMSEKPVKKCPACKGKTEKLIGKGSGIIFKGSGFYHTDYKKKTPPCQSSNKGEACKSCPASDKNKK